MNRQHCVHVHSRNVEVAERYQQLTRQAIKVKFATVLTKFERFSKSYQKQCLKRAYSALIAYRRAVWPNWGPNCYVSTAPWMGNDTTWCSE